MGLMGTKLKLSKEYTIEELFELIKDVPFEAGTPYLANHGPTTYIVFPELNRYNQVVIGGKKGKFTVMRSAQPIGIDKALVNVALSNLTNGLTGFSGAFGKTKKRCEQLAEEAAQQINDMNL